MAMPGNGPDSWRADTIRSAIEWARLEPIADAVSGNKAVPAGWEPFKKRGEA